MLTITLGSLTGHDPSWGGSGVVPVPKGVVDRLQRAHRRRAYEARVPEEEDAVCVLSLCLLGLVEITQTKRAS